MSQQMGNLNIGRIALHQIFERDENRSVVPPRFNSRLSVLNDAGILALKNRVTSALGSNAASIQMNIVKADATSCFQNMAQMIFLDNAGFLEKSKWVAAKLADCQSTRKIPGGIVVTLDGTVGPTSNKFIAVIKAESHEGFALNSSNQDSLELLFMNELLLTPQQKLYKIGIFIEKNPIEDGSVLRIPDEFTTFVYDQNMNRAETKSAALYFYEAFLGCTIHASNKKLTRDFYSNTKEFIGSLAKPDEEKVDLFNALYDYLKVSRDPAISVSSFAERYFTPEIADTYSNFMRSKSFPANTIHKDTDLIKNSLRRRKIKFTSSVTITAPSDRFAQVVQIMSPQEGQEENTTLVKIAGKIEAQ